MYWTVDNDAINIELLDDNKCTLDIVKNIPMGTKVILTGNIEGKVFNKEIVIE